MTKSLNNLPLIQTPKGLGEIEKVYISELGFLMLRIDNLDGTLYKIYQPKVQKKKFIKVTDYIQGSDQLAGHNHLVITSSLKDILS